MHPDIRLSCGRDSVVQVPEECPCIRQLAYSEFQANDPTCPPRPPRLARLILREGVLVLRVSSWSSMSRERLRQHVRSTNDGVHRVAAGGSSKTEKPPAATPVQRFVIWCSFRRRTRHDLRRCPTFRCCVLCFYRVQSSAIAIHPCEPDGK